MGVSRPGILVVRDTTHHTLHQRLRWLVYGESQCTLRLSPIRYLLGTGALISCSTGEPDKCFWTGYERPFTTSEDTRSYPRAVELDRIMWQLMGRRWQLVPWFNKRSFWRLWTQRPVWSTDRGWAKQRRNWDCGRFLIMRWCLGFIRGWWRRRFGAKFEESLTQWNL